MSISVVVDLLFILLLSISVGVLCLVLVLQYSNTVLTVLSSFATILLRKRAGYFTLFVFLLSCDN